MKKFKKFWIRIRKIAGRRRILKLNLSNIDIVGKQR